MLPIYERPAMNVQLPTRAVFLKKMVCLFVAASMLSPPAAMAAGSDALYRIPLKTSAMDGEGMLELRPSLTDFGSVAVTQTRMAQATLVNTGTWAVSGIQAQTNAPFAADTSDCGTLAAGASCKVLLSFSPAATGFASANLNVRSSAGDIAGQLLGNGARLLTDIEVSSDLWYFGNWPLGQTSDSRQLVLHNKGTKNFTFGQLALVAGAGDYNLDSGCGTELAAGAYCTVKATFTPAETGLRLGAFRIQGTDGSLRDVNMVGYGGVGTAQGAKLSVASAVNFGDVALNELPPPQRLVVSNIGTEMVTVQQPMLSGRDAAAFSLESTCSGELLPWGTCEITLAASAQAEPRRLEAEILIPSTEPLSPRTVLVFENMVHNVRANLVAEPSVLRLDAQALGETATGKLTLTNKGPDKAQIRQVTPVSALLFSADPSCDQALDVEESCEVNVTYTAKDLGATDGRLDIETATGASMTVRLIGNLPAPAIRLSPNALKFERGQPVGTTSTASEVKVLNEGTAALTVKGVSLVKQNMLEETTEFAQSNSCGEPLAPNQSCVISVSFRPSEAGEQRGVLVIESNDPRNPVASVAVSAAGIAANSEVALSTGNLSFGNVPVAQAARQSVVIKNVGNVAAQVTGVELTPESTRLFEQNNTCGNTMRPNESCAVVLTFKPLELGESTGTLVVQLADGTTQQVNLSGRGVEVTEQPQLVVRPSLVNLGSAIVGRNPAYQTVTLENAGNSVLRIASIGVIGDDGDVTTQFAQSNSCGDDLPSGGECTVSLAFSPAGPGLSIGHLVIDSNDPVTPISLVELRGNGVAGWVEVSPRLIEFPITAVDSRAERSIVVFNRSVQPTVVTGIGMKDATAPFTQVNACSETLAPDSSCTITVTFEPKQQGDYRGVLAVATSDGSVIDVSLKGAGSTSDDPPAASRGISISPNPLDFGVVKSGTTASLPVTVRNYTEESQVIRSASATAGGSVFSVGNSCVGELVAGASCTFQVSAKAPASGTSQGTLALSFVNSQYDLQTSMLVTGSAQAAAASFTASPNFLDFGLVAQGGAQQLVAVRNTGAGPMRLNVALSQTSADISATGCTDLIEAGQFCELVVSYSGQTRGSTNGVFSLSSTGAAMQQVRVEGRGPEPAVSVSAGELTFPGTGTNLRSAVQSLTVSNTGTADMQIRNAYATEGFVVTSHCPATLAPGGACNVDVQFAPMAAGEVKGFGYVATDAGNGSVRTIALTGTGLGPNLSFSEESVNFPELPLNAFESRTVTLSNSGVGSAALGAIGAPAGSGFEVAHGCPGMLAQGESCNIDVTFSPVDGGRHAADLTVQANGQALKLALTGFGPPAQLALETTTFTFEPQAVEIPSSEQYLRVTNTGVTNARVYSATIPADSPFKVATVCNRVLAPGEFCNIGMTFSPTAVGESTGTVTVVTNNTGGTLQANLVGNGVAPTASIAPASLNFGAMYAGRSKTLTANVTNTSQLPMLLHSVQGDGPFTGKINCEMPVRPGESCEIAVTAAPRAGGLLQGTLTVRGTAATAPTIAAQVTSTQVTLTSVSPDRVPTAGNVEVRLTGTGFGPAPKVMFAGQPAVSVRPVSATQMYATVPAHSAGTYAVSLAEGDAAPVALSSGITYVAAPQLSGISPNRGPAAGGWVATLTGTSLTCPMTVSVEGKEIEIPTCSGTKVEFNVPARSVNASGTVDVGVRNEGGTSTLAGALQYVRDAAALAFPSGGGDFGNVLRDTPSSRSVVLTNTGTLPAQIRSYSLQGATSSFRINGGTCPTALPAQLPAGRSCTIVVEMTGSEGTASAVLQVNAGSEDIAELPLSASFVQPNFVFSSTVNSTVAPPAEFPPVAALSVIGRPNSPTSRALTVFFNNVGLVAGAKLSNATLTITGPQAERFAVRNPMAYDSTGTKGVSTGTLLSGGRLVTGINTTDGAGANPHLRLFVDYTPTTEGVDVAQIRVDYGDGSFALLPLVGSAAYDATASLSGATVGSEPPADFGNLSFNVSAGTTASSKTNTFYVRNATSVPEAVLKVSRISIAGPDATAFSLASCTGTRVTAQDCRPTNMTQASAATALSFGVIFKPVREGAHRATLVVEHSGYNEGGVLSLPLTGSSVRDVNIAVSAGANVVPLADIYSADGRKVPVNWSPLAVATFVRNMGSAGQVVYSGVQIEGSPAFTLAHVGLVPHSQMAQSSGTSYTNARTATFNLVGADPAVAGSSSDLRVGLAFYPLTEGEHRATVTVFHDGPGGQTTYELVGHAENRSNLILSVSDKSEYDMGITSLTGTQSLAILLSQPKGESRVRLDSFELTGPDADQFVVTTITIPQGATPPVFNSVNGVRSALLNIQMGGTTASDGKGTLTLVHKPTRPGTHAVTVSVKNSGVAGVTNFPVTARVNAYADLTAAAGFAAQVSNNNFTARLQGASYTASSFRIGSAQPPVAGRYYFEVQVARAVSTFDAMALTFGYTLPNGRPVYHQLVGESGALDYYNGNSTTPIGNVLGGAMKAGDRIGVAVDAGTREYRLFHYTAANLQCREVASFTGSGAYGFSISGLRATNSNSVTLTNGAVGNYACPIPAGYVPLPNKY